MRRRSVGRCSGRTNCKSGWVAPLKDQKSLDLIKAWIEESYRAIAPKKLVGRLQS